MVTFACYLPAYLAVAANSPAVVADCTAFAVLDRAVQAATHSAECIVPDFEDCAS